MVSAEEEFSSFFYIYIYSDRALWAGGRVGIFFFLFEKRITIHDAEDIRSCFIRRVVEVLEVETG